MQSCEFITTITALACAITDCCSKEEVTILAITFSHLGNTLSTALAIDAINEVVEKGNGENNANQTTENEATNNTPNVTDSILDNILII